MLLLLLLSSYLYLYLLARLQFYFNFVSLHWFNFLVRIVPYLRLSDNLITYFGHERAFTVRALVNPNRGDEVEGTSMTIVLGCQRWLHLCNTWTLTVAAYVVLYSSDVLTQMAVEISRLYCFRLFN